MWRTSSFSSSLERESNSSTSMAGDDALDDVGDIGIRSNACKASIAQSAISLVSQRDFRTKKP